MSQFDVAPAPSAPMAPTRAEVQRRLSTRSKSSQPPPVATGQIGSGNESDSSVASSSHPGGGGLGSAPLATPNTHFATSPVTSPVVGPHGGLSAIAEGQGSSLDMATEDIPNDLDLEDADDDSEDGDQAPKEDAGVDSQRVYKSGFLIKKQERRTVGPAWKKKWFVLRPTRLAYYKDNREYSLLRAIELKEVHSVVPVTREKAKHPFSFAIVTADRTFFVEALSAEERDDWVRAINAVRKQMSDKEDDTRRRDQAVAVPVPTQQQLQAEMDVETHQGTWTSTFSTTTGASASPTAGGGSFIHRHAAPAPSAYQAPSQSAYPSPAQPSYQAPAPSSYQAPSTPRGPPQPPRSPSPNTGAMTTQMSGMGVGRSQSVTAPSAAAVNRRLSNPIVHPPNLQPPSRQHSHRRDTSAEAATLSPPPSGTFVSSDEEDMYFSDQPQWSEAQHQQQQPQGSLADPWVADPNKIIVATYLMKKSRKTTREVWRKRWFFLTSSGMTYSKSHMDTRPLAFVPLTTILDVFSIEEADDVEVDDSSDDSRPGHHPTRRPSTRKHRDPTGGAQQEQHVIRIVTNKRRFDLCAPSEEEEIKWIAAIRALVNREREKRQPPAGAAGAGAGPGTGATGNATGGTGTSVPPGKIPLPLNVPTIAQQPPTPSSLPPASPTSSPHQPPPMGMDSPTPSHPTKPTHGRSRSATQTAKNAVADVVRRFHEGDPAHV